MSAHRPPRIIAVIPAHNEQDTIAAAVGSLKAQDVPPTEIHVIGDNCTDDTEHRALLAGATSVFTTTGNMHRKAGALNQFLAQPSFAQEPYDTVILVMDADCTLDTGWIEAALVHLRHRRIGGVGGTFRGGPGGGFVGHLQRNEFARYQRDLSRLRGKALVLTGTAAAFRLGTLRHIVREREAGQRLPAVADAGVYDVDVLTEDAEISLALKHLGYRLIAPPECTLMTEVMPTWRALARQRLRWKRGMVENLVQYGLTRVTWRYWGRQAFTGVGIAVTAIYLATTLWALVTWRFYFQSFWLSFTVIFALERAVTVRQRGWKHALAAATFYELPFDIFLQGVHAKAYLDATLRRSRSW